MYTPKNSKHFRSHSRAIMAHGHSRLGLEKKILGKQIRRNFFAFDGFTLLILANKSGGVYLGCQRLFMRSFRFRSSLKKWPGRKASGSERHPFDSAEPITTPLIPKHPESRCFADWFLGDTECFKCSDWITITIGAWSGHGCFEGDKDQIQRIQPHITYVFAFWERTGNTRCLYERKI